MLLPKGAPNAALFGTSPTRWSAIQESFDTAKECEQACAKSVLPPMPATVEPTLLQERLSIASVLMTIDSVEMSVVVRGTE